MPLLARYALETGIITGVWESTNPESLAANQRPDDPGFGYLFTQGMSPSALQEGYVVVDGTLTAQAPREVTAVAVPAVAPEAPPESTRADAVLTVLLEELNMLRVDLGLPARTRDEIQARLVSDARGN